MAVPASSNPITSVAPNSNPITSVSPNNYVASPLYPSPTNPQLLSRLNLDLRGTIFPVEREMLMLLPESVLLGLFPQGLILSKPASWEGADDGIFTVDFDPNCFRYIIDFWSKAQDTFYGSPTTSGLYHAQQRIPTVDALSDHSQNPLLSKQAIIVLREELEYFSITKPGAAARTDIATGLANEDLRVLKRNCGRALEEKKAIFAALERNVNNSANLAERHLIDMLCVSGFNRDDEWGYRACEPQRNVISSMALVLLKTGINHREDNKEGPPEIDPVQMGTAQKLLLFWRKPARKCWWDSVEIDVPSSLDTESHETISVKVWARRVWTLELSLI
ncbi:phosphatase activator [Cryptococcus neoformans Ze90-1]|nr:phosphatase activator [Cryptococcus neoformans var. grubii Ze90-1]